MTGALVTLRRFAKASCALPDEDAEALGAALRRAWSLLYARQGSGVAIFPYESAFVHVREGLPGSAGRCSVRR